MVFALALLFYRGKDTPCNQQDDIDVEKYSDECLVICNSVRIPFQQLFIEHQYKLSRFRQRVTAVKKRHRRSRPPLD